MVHDATDAMIGSWILDQYHVLERIAEGGMGRVYLAEQVAMERFAAIKILTPSIAAKTNDSRRRRFRQEARAAIRLAHPNIITVYNFGELADGTLFLAMEYIRGESLADLISDDRGPEDVQRILEIMAECAAALGHAHSKSVVHRDFKPENIMLGVQDGEDAELVKVVDFGIAQIVEEDAVTASGEVIGTPRYLSPEVCRGEPATAKSDQYAFGLVLHELLSGEPAFVADSTLGYLHMHQYEDPAELRSELPELRELVDRMLNKRPEARFGSMAEVEAELFQIARQISGQHAVLSLREHPHAVTSPLPRTVAWLGDQRPSAADVDAFSEAGLMLLERESKADSGTTDAAVLNLAAEGWAERAEDWSDLSSSSTLVCVDADPGSPAVHQMVDRFDNLCVGPHPVDSEVLALAMSWALRSGQPAIQLLGRDEPIQIAQVRSATQKTIAVDALVDDAEMQGMRQQERLRLAEIAEELIINAIYRGPTGSHTAARRGDLDEQLPQGHEVTLAWFIQDDRTAISVRDGFGTLTRRKLFSYLTSHGRANHAGSGPRGAGMGMGLQLVGRSATHVLSAVSPGHWCEILVLIDRRGRSSSRRRSLTALTHAGWDVSEIGERLTMRSYEGREQRFVQLVGDINESADLASVFSYEGPTSIDMGQVRRANSMGVRRWIEAARERPRSSRLTFTRCSLAWVRQLSMTNELLAFGPIESALVPLFCEICGLEQTQSYDVEQLDKDQPPAADCPGCGKPMSVDAPWNAYTAFLE